MSVSWCTDVDGTTTSTVETQTEVEDQLPTAPRPPRPLDQCVNILNSAVWQRLDTFYAVSQETTLISDAIASMYISHCCFSTECPPACYLPFCSECPPACYMPFWVPTCLLHAILSAHLPATSHSECPPACYMPFWVPTCPIQAVPHVNLISPVDLWYSFWFSCHCFLFLHYHINLPRCVKNDKCKCSIQGS